MHLAGIRSGSSSCLKLLNRRFTTRLHAKGICITLVFVRNKRAFMWSWWTGLASPTSRLSFWLEIINKNRVVNKVLIQILKLIFIIWLSAKIKNTSIPQLVIPWFVIAEIFFIPIFGIIFSFYQCPFSLLWVSWNQVRVRVYKLLSSPWLHDTSGINLVNDLIQTRNSHALGNAKLMILPGPPQIDQLYNSPRDPPSKTKKKPA